MTQRRLVRLLVAIVLIAGLLPATIGTVIEAMSARSIESQDGWSGGTIPIDPRVDQIVDQSGLHQRTGTGAWRISNNTSLGGYNGNFAGWPFAPGLSVSAGQPLSGAGANQFTATLWFRSASASADGSNIEVDLGTVAGDDRNTFLALTNLADGVDGGLQLRVSEPDGATGNFRPTVTIATGITRGVYHRLDIVANFHDGPTNDTVSYALDGVPLANPVGGGTTFGTFEGFREGIGSPYVLSNRLFFRSGAAPSAFGAFVDTAAQGFYFDDLFYAVANQSAPATRLAAYATGFEPGFSPGSVEGQESWSGGMIPIDPRVDQIVDQSGLNQRTGTGAWRISNNTSLSGGYNGNFEGWPFAPGLSVSAGQPSSGAGANQFTATLWFRSASASADGSNIEVDLGTVAGDDRNTFLALTNRADGVDGGLQLRVSEPDGATGNFRPTVTIATGITRGVYHRLDIVANFQDGSANDTVAYTLDGVLLVNPVVGGTTFGTFEGFREGIGSPYVQSNRLFFRSGPAPSAFGAAFVDTAAQGFYFDDLFYFVANQAAPANSLAAYATGFEPPAVPAPDLTITKSHVGNFIQGQIGAQFTVTVTNSGTPSTIGVVTLTDAVPSGLTPTAASGTGWTCAPGATVTCTRSDALAPGASYPPVTITVNVAASAPASVTNTATVSGGGDVNATNNTATDVTTILPATSTGVVTAVASFFAFDPAFHGGVSVAAGDVTGDGVSDIITGAGPGGGPNVRVFSLASGVLTQVASFFAYDPAFTGGVHVAVGDVNGDGVADIITGAGPGGGPHVKVFSLAGGVVTQVASFFAYDAALLGGVSVAAADVTGDGVAEIITGTGPGGGPNVRVFSLAGGVVTGVASFLAYDPAFLGGVDVAAADLTGDGVAEIITGPGPGGGPNVSAFSLAGGVATQVASFFAYDPAFLGGVHVAAADLTGDGVAEIITGAGSGGGPHVRAFSLAGGSVTGVASFFAYDPAFLGGVYVAAADLTRDGVAEIITGAGPGGGPHVRVLDVSGVTVK